MQTWRRLTPDVRTLKYSWGPATANALAIKMGTRPASNRWMVVGCPIAPSPEVFADLENDGEISALLAPNAYHYLGQRDWRARHPSATTYAPKGAFPRLAEKSPGIDYRNIDELVLPPSVTVILPDGQKSPDALIRVRAGSETIWWMGDLFSNTTKDDAVWWLRLVSRFAGSGLGYRCNSRPELVYVSDRRAWLRSIRSVLEESPPTMVVPAHGDVVFEDTARRTTGLLHHAYDDA